MIIYSLVGGRARCIAHLNRIHSFFFEFRKKGLNEHGGRLTLKSRHVHATFQRVGPQRRNFARQRLM